MANPEHVEIVKQGAEAINEWRKSRPDERLDLRDADLSGLALHSADFSNADLSRANLKNTDLFHTNFSSSRLFSTSFFRAYLEDADLSSADLTEANLMGTHLAGTSLRSADLSWSLLGETLMINADFSFAKGLARVNHISPSALDMATLHRSTQPLPLVFLQGCGLPDQLIEYLPSLMGQAIEFYSCFISYSSKDDEFARRLHADLQAEGVRCWFAPEDLKIGERFRRSIEDAIRLHDKLLLILSEDSVNSTWVEDEVESALEKERKAKERGEDRTVLFPIRLDSAVMETDAAWAAAIRRTRHIGDFTAWKDHDAYQNSFERLLRDLKSGATKE